MTKKIKYLKVITKEPKPTKKFNGELFKFSGFTWSKKGNQRRKKLWEKLGFKVKFIPSGGYTAPPLPRSKYLVYTKKSKKKSKRRK